MLPSNIPPVKIFCYISCCSIIALVFLPTFTCSFTLLPSACPKAARCMFLSLRSHSSEGLLFLREIPHTVFSIGRRQSMVLYSSSGVNRRKRRRRKDSPDGDNNEEEADDGPELPDFDLDEDDGVKSTKKGAVASPASSSVDPLLGPITPNMMAASRNPSTASSVNDLLRDRSLEQKLERLYEEGGSEPEEALPDLLSLQRKSTTGTSAASLSKRERQILARQQQDKEQQKQLQSIENEEDLSALVSKLPFITNEQGKVVPIKILETATWACIIALILWELYINSPLFTRAAPIIPVVYDIWI